MRLTDDLRLVEVEPKGSATRGKPVATVCQYRARTDIVINPAALAAAKWNPGQHVQVFVSASQIQIRACFPNAQGARRINKSRRISIPEITKYWQLQEGERWAIPMEPIGERAASLLGTLPRAYRDLLAQREHVRAIA